MKKLLSIALAVWLLTACQFGQEKQTSLNIPLSDWQFKSEQDTVWRDAQVPGVVHLDLWRHHIIENPFWGTHEADQQWIGFKKWIYKTQFSKQNLDEFEHLILQFDGLDTYAQIYLNGKLIKETDNMFRSWEVDLKGRLQAENQLEIHFLPSEAINEEKANRLPYRLPDNRVFTRKAPYQFGWDWGAKFLTAGIWKPVRICANNEAKIKQVQWETQRIIGTSAMLKGVVEIEAYEKQTLNLNLSFNHQTLRQEVRLKKGLNEVVLEPSISDVKLWYPRGLGQPNLYHFKLELLKGETLLDSDEKAIGVRNVELVQEKDSTGQSFYFKINGKPLFIKGANYIPQDNFLTRVDAKRYQKLINSATWANMNMLRVWGGGIYEDDIFYELCDQNGILVWQDFMFACAMYPGDRAFLDNVEQEITEQVKRLKHHPSIVLWCGNNEVDNGWKDWGWQKQLGYSPADSAQIWKGYQALFHQLIPKILHRWDSLRPYHPSSPTYGWGHPENFQYGDSHYWGVWWGHEPFEVFNHKVGRFMSEYGFQSMPNMSTVRSFCDEKEQYLFSKTLKAHQKHPTGYETILEYMKRAYRIPKSLGEFVYVSQVLQAEGMKTAIEAHRRNQPHCMGTLYWQLNDCWPVCSWSSIDYEYRKKGLHYYVREAYKNVILSSFIENDQLKVYGISNDVPTQNYHIKMCQIDFEGDTLKHFESALALEQNTSCLILNKDLKLFDKQAESYWVSEISTADTFCDVSYLFFDKVKHLQLPKVQLNIQIEKRDKAYLVRLFSDVFVKDLALESNIEGEFSENYFNLPAKQSRELWFYPQKDKELTILYRCMNNVH